MVKEMGLFKIGIGKRNKCYEKVILSSEVNVVMAAYNNHQTIS